MSEQATTGVRCAGTALALAVGLLSGGCERSAAPESRPMPLPVDVLADTANIVRLPRVPFDTAPPRAAVWLTRVSPRRATLLETPVPLPPETLSPPPPAEPPLLVDPNLKPPILRHAVPLRVPRGARGVVELDVRVAEDGSVSDALWAAGTSDSILVGAAVECALAMRFYPALQGERPAAVWCRQRFDFSRR